MKKTHIIEASYDDEKERAYWQCDCGRAGSCDTYNVDIVAEKHVPSDEFVIWRRGGGAS